jgi:8-hydroxy-5-deazaflavin:NADPH oxidoreductase
MKIGIIGSGNIGGTAGTMWARQGHEVMFSSRNPQSLASLVEAAGPNAQAGTVEQAAAFGEVVLLAIPWTQRRSLTDLPLAGKIVIDALNPYAAGGVEDLGDSTSSEEVAKLLPGARLVKAFNTMYFRTLQSAGTSDEAQRLVLFVAGDDDDAKAIVAGLIEEIGFAAVDTGSLREGGRKQQPGSPIYNTPLTVPEAQQRLSELS